MTGLLDGRLRMIAGTALGKYYLDATLYRAVQTRDLGGDITEVSEGETVKAQKDRCTEQMRQAPGYTDKDVRIIVLQHGVSIVPNSNDEIVLAGIRWAISMVSADPAETHWSMRGTPAGTE